MKFLFLLENYNWFYTSYLEQNRNLTSLKHEQVIQHLLALNYYQSDSLGDSLQKLGHTVEYLIPHCYKLQEIWAREHDRVYGNRWKFGKLYRDLRVRILKDYEAEARLSEKTLIAQVKSARPDVLYMYSGVGLSNDTLKELKKYCVKMILQWSCPVLEELKDFGFGFFDLITTSSVEIKSYFESRKIPVCFIQQAFDERIIERFKKVDSKKKELVFIGTFNERVHQRRIEILEYLSCHTEIDIYCPEIKDVSGRFDSILKKRKGSTGGTEMFETYSKYKMALHIPGDEFLNDAGAKRLFEVTGIGTFLLTLQQENLSEFFVNGKEIVTFTDMNDCMEKIKYYLEHNEEREKIAFAGQQRTLRDHTFKQRSVELLEEIC